MSPYRLKHNESESNIKNYNSLYKNTKKAKTLSTTLKKHQKIPKIPFFCKNPKFYFAFSTRSTIRIFYYYFWLITVFEKMETFKNPNFSKAQICILHSVHVPQFICFIFFRFSMFFYNFYNFIFLYIYIFNYLIIYLII